jgi:hypothetical protein
MTACESKMTYDCITITCKDVLMSWYARECRTSACHMTHALSSSLHVCMHDDVCMHAHMYDDEDASTCSHMHACLAPALCLAHVTYPTHIHMIILRYNITLSFRMWYDEDACMRCDTMLYIEWRFWCPSNLHMLYISVSYILIRVQYISLASNLRILYIRILYILMPYTI